MHQIRARLTRQGTGGGPCSGLACYGQPVWHGLHGPRGPRHQRPYRGMCPSSSIIDNPTYQLT